MIKDWKIGGDQHGCLDEVLKLEVSNPEQTGLIFLGDFGCNFWLDKHDVRMKEKMMETGYQFYLVRGNHEEHPKNLPNITKVYDEETHNTIYQEPDFPNIHYLIDNEIYQFGPWTAYIAGGAYSIDKEYRLAKNANSNWTGWFPDEQCSIQEMYQALTYCCNTEPIVDFVFAHTCPYEWQPRDLFLPFVDQSKVDTRTENWLTALLCLIQFKTFLCGHFHDERQLAPHAYMLYTKIHDLKEYDLD